MKPSQPQESVPSLRIFVVEDHRDTRDLLTMYLESLGHTVCSARTMVDALQALPQSACEVLISDIGLPDGDGWQLMEKAQLPPTVYAVAMSGFGMDADRLKSKAVGFRRHLLKPLVPKELDAALAEASRETAGRK